MDRISFSIEKGAVLGLVAESGSSKSTTVRLLLRLLEPSGGRSEYQERESLRAGAQSVFQDLNSSRSPRMSIDQALTRPRCLYAMPEKYRGSMANSQGNHAGAPLRVHPGLLVLLRGQPSCGSITATLFGEANGEIIGTAIAPGYGFACASRVEPGIRFALGRLGRKISLALDNRLREVYHPRGDGESEAVVDCERSRPLSRWTQGSLGGTRGRMFS